MEILRDNLGIFLKSPEVFKKDGIFYFNSLVEPTWYIARNPWIARKIELDKRNLYQRWREGYGSPSKYFPAVVFRHKFSSSRSLLMMTYPLGVAVVPVFDQGVSDKGLYFNSDYIPREEKNIHEYAFALLRYREDILSTLYPLEKTIMKAMKRKYKTLEWEIREGARIYTYDDIRALNMALYMRLKEIRKRRESRRIEIHGYAQGFLWIHISEGEETTIRGILPLKGGKFEVSCFMKHVDPARICRIVRNYVCLGGVLAWVS